MTLLIITSLKEYLGDIAALLKQAQIDVFSVTKTTGIRTAGASNLLEDWFGSGAGEFDSIVLFSFTGEEQSKKAIELVTAYNIKQQDSFPVKAFTMAVEASC